MLSGHAAAAGVCQSALKRDPMRWMALAAVCVVLHAAISRAGTAADCGVPAATQDGWPVSPPAQQGLDPQLICS